MSVHYTVEGGFTGQMRSLTIADDGTLEVARSGAVSAGRIEPEQLAAITAALDRSQLFDRDREYPPGAGADLQRYEIRYQGHTVVAHDTTVPAELAGALTLLDEVLNSA